MLVHCKVKFDLLFSQRLFLKFLSLFWFMMSLLSTVEGSESKSEGLDIDLKVVRQKRKGFLSKHSS